MRHAKWLAVLVLAGSISGCCDPRWPTTHSLPPPHRAIRYIAQAVKIADDRCVKEANTQVELEGCQAVYDTLKPVILKLETP